MGNFDGETSSTEDPISTELIRQRGIIEGLLGKVEKLEKRDIEKSMSSLLKSLKFICWFFPIIALVMLIGYLFLFERGSYNQLIILAATIIIIIQVGGFFINRK